VNLLRGQAQNENSDLEFIDLSVKEPYESDRADYIRQKITERINQTSMIVVYLSKDTAQSKWVKWEVEKSIALGKDVMATHSGDQPEGPLPDLAGDPKIKVIPWAQLADELKKK
jgi:hypothetical protein